MKAKWTLEFTCRKRKIFAKKELEFVKSKKSKFRDAYRDALEKLGEQYSSAHLNTSMVMLDLVGDGKTTNKYFQSVNIETEDFKTKVYVYVYAGSLKEASDIVTSFFEKQDFLNYRLEGALRKDTLRDQEELDQLKKELEESKQKATPKPVEKEVTPQVQPRSCVEEAPVLGHCPNCVHCVKEWPYLYCSEITEKRFGVFGEEVMKKVDSNGTCDHFIAKKTSDNSNYRRG